MSVDNRTGHIGITIRTGRPLATLKRKCHRVCFSSSSRHGKWVFRVSVYIHHACIIHTRAHVPCCLLPSRHIDITRPHNTTQHPPPCFLYCRLMYSTCECVYVAELSILHTPFLFRRAGAAADVVHEKRQTPCPTSRIATNNQDKMELGSRAGWSSIVTCRVDGQQIRGSVP